LTHGYPLRHWCMMAGHPHDPKGLPKSRVHPKPSTSPPSLPIIAHRPTAHPGRPQTHLHLYFHLPATDVRCASPVFGMSTLICLSSSIPIQPSPQGPCWDYGQTAEMCARYVNDLFHCPDQPPPSSPSTPLPSHTSSPMQSIARDSRPL
jgi:hypothetical protein